MNFRLRAVLISSSTVSEDIVDLTRIKENASPVPGTHKLEQGTQTEWKEPDCPNVNNVQQTVCSDEFNKIQIKEEPKSLSPLKEESEDTVDFGVDFSDDSDDMSLITFKKKKKNKKELNGINKKSQKKKKLKEWTIVNGIPEGTSLTIVNDAIKSDVKEELEQKPELDVTVDVKVVKSEPGEAEVFNCCICFLQCYSRGDILQHYR